MFGCDAWGREWIYEPPTATTSVPRLRSLGNDAEPGGRWWNADLEASLQSSAGR
jgi:hypothetical protein